MQKASFSQRILELTGRTKQVLKSLWQRWLVRWGRFAERYPRWSRILRFGFLLGGGFFGLLILGWLILLWSIPSVRELRQLETEVATEVYAADSVLLGRYFNEFRTIVDLQEMPEHLLDGLVATEDERFYQHGGIDLRSWGRVFYRTILRGDDSGGGGSTISQQLAKNLFPRQNYRLLSLPINKIREIIIATRLERAYEKKALLALYLNTVPFSENVYGIEVASRRFFDKKPRELTIEEGATLIGTLRATSYYNPNRFPDRATQRRNVVLGQMVKNNYLTAAVRDSLVKLPLTLNYNPIIKNQGLAPYFREYVRLELDKLLKDLRKPNGDPYDINRDGLKVYTTLHSGLQAEAEAAVREHFEEMQKNFDQQWRNIPIPGEEAAIEQMRKQSLRYQRAVRDGLKEAEIDKQFNTPLDMTLFSWDGEKQMKMTPQDSLRYYFRMLQVGFIAVEPYTGFVRAWVGGIDHERFQFDHVVARRQAGSAFKPFVYAQALRNGINPCDQIPNNLIVYHEYRKGEWMIKNYRQEDPEPHINPTTGKDEDDWVPQNADGKYGGSYSMEGALTNSINTITVSLIMRTGVDAVIDLAQKLGITSEIPREPSIALGTAEVSLLDMTTAFATIASRGQKVTPKVIQRIETQDGKVLLDLSKSSSSQVLEVENADMITRMLQSVASYGTASRLRWRYGLTTQPIAGKTGTTQNHADGWFVGFNPALAAGVWVGGDSPLVRFRNFEYGQGAASALPVWALFMKRVYDNPQLVRWQGQAFPTLEPSLAARLNCPAHIKSPEEILADSLAADSLLQLELLRADSLLLENN
ncbi:MAG: transglycosylase domain-containing protein [Lewinellaceae bacterium]|nr:transglycosylase domain-containing protein [Lewinellaceae bacterium]